MIAQMKVDTPNNELVYGKGGFSDGILNFAPADAILALGFAMDLSKFIELAEKEIIPEFGDDIKLNEPMPELGGLSIKDAIASFTGEFMVSLTDVKMPDSGAGGAFLADRQWMHNQAKIHLVTPKWKKETFLSLHLGAEVGFPAEDHHRGEWTPSHDDGCHAKT